jgi:hypothetical protein
VDPPAAPDPLSDAGTLWQTGFEDGFAAFDAADGSCFASPASSYGVVASPVRSGNAAAAFQAGANATEDGYMAHCVRYGDLQVAAYYGAWFFVPNEVTDAAVWALMHFDGNGDGEQHELWDVRLEPDGAGGLSVHAFDYLRMATLLPEAHGELPVATWFHLEVYWSRARDASGAFELYVDGELALSVHGVVTDDAATSEWYVGNFAAWTTPNPSIVYVDDVTIAATRQGGM